MQWGASSLFLKTGFREPILLVNLVLRFLLLCAALGLGHWIGGDSGYFIGAAAKTCGGEWGGDLSRSPFYMWFLCGLSPGIQNGADWPMFVAPLLVQTVLVWICGVWLFRKFGKLVAVLWLYDPVGLIYSNLIMTDTVFSLAALFLTWQVYRLFSNADQKANIHTRQLLPTALPLGLALALCVLVRPIGQVLFFFSVLFFISAIFLVPKFQKNRSLLLKKVSVAVVFALLFLAPRLLWNYSKHQVFRVENQGKYWVHSVAGAVEHFGKGLDYVQSERLWNKEHPTLDNADAYRTILTKFPVWMFLTAKGVVRVLVGHVNTEWCMLFSGEAPIGPGWFKVTDQRTGWKIQGWQVFPWLLGILLTAVFSLSAYFILVKRIVRQRAYSEVFLWWCLAATAFMAITPQLWGDARFRLGFWPMILVALAVCERSRSRS